MTLSLLLSIPLVNQVILMENDAKIEDLKWNLAKNANKSEINSQKLWTITSWTKKKGGKW